MQQFALFSFYGNLNDFLSKKDRNQKITYSFKAIPTVKDAIEAIGIPHVEVEWLQINGPPALFSHPLHPGDEVKVYPQDTPPAEGFYAPIRRNSQRPHSFVLDMHLGTLARRLRLLGIDTLYHKQISDKELAHISSNDHRIVLTRDISLLKQKIIEWGYWLRSQQPEVQLLEVVKRYSLVPFMVPFSRCLSCNGLIHPVKKDTVLDLLPQGTSKYFNDFYQCFDCRKVYWKGSHYERMTQLIENIKQKL